MRRVDRRVVEVVAPFAAGISWASGYRIAATLVLTARHVVVAEDAASEACAVRPLGSAEFVSATVAWVSASLDFAVLRVEPGALPSMHAGLAPRWGRFQGSQPVPCRLTGFPVAHSRTDQCGRQVRDPEPVDGMLKLATAAKREVVDISIVGSAPEAVTQGSPWQGMSGAAVLCGPWLVGVVTSDPANFGPDRLSATLIETALTDPSLLVLLAEEHVPSQLEIADLPRALQIPYRAPPSALAPGRPGRSLARLLQPEFEVVPFVGRDAELSGLTGWCAADEGVAVRLLTWPGGQGKTRLALELCRQQAAAGWLTGLLTENATVADVDAMLAVPAPLLIVVDWADTKVEEVLGLVQRAVVSAAGPVRLLLLARNVGEWWAGLPYRASGVAEDVFAAGDTMFLAPLADHLQARREQFWSAAKAYADRLGRSWETVLEPDLSAPLFETLLFIHLAALVAVEPAPNGQSGNRVSSELLNELLRREDVSYWEAVAPPVLQGDTARVTRQRAVAVATLTAAQTEDEARSALQALPDFAQANLTPALYWLHDLYPAQSYLGPLRPDLLGEALVAQVIAARPDLPLRLLPDADRTWATRLLTVLAQTAGTDARLAGVLHETLVSRLKLLVAKARAAADASLGHALALALKQTDSVELAGTLVGGLPPSRSLAMAEVAVAGFQVLLAHDHQPEQSAYLFGSLSFWLTEIGRYDQAIENSRRAVVAARDIAGRKDGPSRVQLAKVLIVLTQDLAHVERYEEGLTAVDEAIAILRVESGTTSDVPEYLSVALAIRAGCLVSLGRERETIDALDEAVAIVRPLAELHDRFRPRLADRLVQLSDLRRRWGDEKQSTEAIAEALDIYRELAASDSDAYRAELAAHLVNASQLLFSNGMGPQALELAAEAVPLCRELAGINPDRYRPWLATALDAQANCIMSLEGPADEWPVREEAVAVYRDLAQAASSYRPLLAIALNRKAECLSSLGRVDEALATISEAAAALRQAKDTATEERQRVAEALVSQSQLLSALNHTGKALDAIEEAVEIYRFLAAKSPEVYHVALAETLTLKSGFLINAGCAAEALTAIEEATKLPHAIASDQPKSFWALFRALLEKANQLDRAGRGEEAQATRNEAGHLPMPVGMIFKIPSPGDADPPED